MRHVRRRRRGLTLSLLLSRAVSSHTDMLSSVRAPPRGFIPVVWTADPCRVRLAPSVTDEHQTCAHGPLDARGLEVARSPMRASFSYSPGTAGSTAPFFAHQRPQRPSLVCYACLFFCPPSFRPHYRSSLSHRSEHSYPRRVGWWHPSCVRLAPSPVLYPPAAALGLLRRPRALAHRLAWL
ncbi:hypothetical protein C8J57DRAFT_174079 [Mycena rebaudengoi]|nr:hypothetical protein C8J57DRAFT_174079 [Mycena rebaudengoi]